MIQPGLGFRIGIMRYENVSKSWDTRDLGLVIARFGRIRDLAYLFAGRPIQTDIY